MTLKAKFRVMVAVSAGGLLAVAAFWIQGQYSSLPRMKLRGYLDGRENLDAGKLASHRDCELGKWLYAAGGAAYGHLPEFQRLEETHQKMHGKVRQVVELKHAGQAAEAERQFSDVCAAADEVIALLTKVETQVAGPGSRGRAASIGA